MAVDNGIKTIAFPAMGVGNAGFATNKAAKIGVDAVKGFWEENPNVIDNIIWVFYKEDVKKVFDAELGL